MALSLQMYNNIKRKKNGKERHPPPSKQDRYDFLKSLKFY
jgi:hypothetical protein